MNKKYQGIFIFNEWLDALNRLPPKTAMTIINNIRRFIMEGVQPPPMKGNAELIQAIMLAYEQRSKESSVNGRKGVEAKRRYQQETETTADAEPQTEITEPPSESSEITPKFFETPSKFSETPSKFSETPSKPSEIPSKFFETPPKTTVKPLSDDQIKAYLRRPLRPMTEQENLEDEQFWADHREEIYRRIREKKNLSLSD